MDIYIVIEEGRHSDTTVKPFHCRLEAIRYAKETARKYCRNTDDYEERPIEGWEFYAQYSCESDCVWVVKSELVK